MGVKMYQHECKNDLNICKHECTNVWKRGCKLLWKMCVSKKIILADLTHTRFSKDMWGKVVTDHSSDWKNIQL